MSVAEPPPKTRDAPIGGQAVLEGVMMRGVSTWAVAVRKPSPEQVAEGHALEPTEAALGEIEVVSEPLVSITKRHRVLRWPIIRGVAALGESLAIGFKALGISANAQLAAEVVEDGKENKIGGATWAGTVIFSIRLAIFLGYLWLISRMRDLQRVFEYHGAEHKTISCYEASLPLTPENAQQFSRFHPRCGTSFLLIVMIVSFFVLVPIGTPEWYILYPTRILAVPLVAGLAVELVKWVGQNRRKRWAQILMWPGIQLQRLTTREPDASQLAVAIAAMEAVLAVEDFDSISEEERAGLEVAA